MLFHTYIVKIKNMNHWYQVLGIDYINNSIIIRYKCVLTPISFFDIEQVKIVEQNKKNTYN